MATRTVNLSEEAYKRLKALKQEGESFSEVVNRITGKYALMDLVGVLSEEEADEVRRHVRDLRRRMRRDVEGAARRLGG